MVVILTPIVLMVVGIPGYIYISMWWFVFFFVWGDDSNFIDSCFSIGLKPRTSYLCYRNVLGERILICFQNGHLEDHRS